jgi:hypothetical protein
MRIRMPKVREIPPEIIAGLKNRPEFAERTDAEQRKILEWMIRIAWVVSQAERDDALSKQRNENGQLLAVEGRAARKQKTDRQAERVCKLYNRIRCQHPPGRRGNGLTLQAVSHQFGPLPSKDQPITVQAIRKILKRCGVSCR